LKGLIERVNDTTILITELPIKKWTADYKAYLEGMVIGSAAAPPEIKDFKENHTDTTVSFTLTAEKAAIDKWEAEKGGLLVKFKLTGSLSTSNMNLFDTEQRITKYNSPQDILKSFFDLRMDYYVKRKELLVQKLQREQRILSNKARFVEEVCSGELVVSNRKKTVLLSDLQERGYELFDKQNEGDAPEAEEAEDVSNSNLSKGYEYLLGMKIWSLTYEKAEELRSQLAERTQELQELEAKSPNDLWLADLDAIEVALDERDIDIQQAHEDEKKAQKKSQKRSVNVKKKAAGAKKGSKKAKGWDSDSDDDDDVDMSSDSEVEVITKKTTVRRKPTAKPAAKPKAAVTSVAPPAVSKEPEKKVEEVDAIELSLAERMKKKMMISPAAAKRPTSKVANMAVDIYKPLSFSEEDNSSPLNSSGDFTESSKGSKKRPSPKAADSDDEFEFIDSVASTSKSSKPAAKKAAAKKPAPKRAKATATVVAKKPAVKKTTAAKGKKKVEEPIDVDSEDDFGMDSDSEAEPVVERTTGARARSARTQVSKKTTYVYSDADSDSDF
jgi:DNA topoisomerase-2